MSSNSKADLLITGSTLIDMVEPIGSKKLDMAVAGGRIMAVAPTGQLAGLAGENTETVDARGRVVMPGLIDSHNHMTLYGHNLQALELTVARVKSMPELLKAVAQRAAETPAGQWVRAWGYDDTKLAEGRHPTVEELDRACPDNPLTIMRTCMHVMAVNSRAMEMAGINADTPHPPGGEIGHDSSGQPNGLLKEICAMALVENLIPLPSIDECAKSLELASQVYVKQGLTTVCEAGAGWTGNPNEVAGFQVALESGQLLPRVCMGLMEETYNLLPRDKGLGLFTRFGNNRLWLGPAKFVGDGGVGARTAAMTEPYQDSETFGVLCFELEDLVERMRPLHKAGFQIAIHAIGDSTLQMVLDAYETILVEHPWPHRHRVEHAAYCPPDLMEKISRLGVVPVMQPGFAHHLGDSYIENLGPERINHTLALRSMLEMGITVVGSSDRPVTPGNPWVDIWAAVNRQTSGGQILNPGQGISPVQALKVWITNGAYVNYMEDKIGSLQAGKLADFIIIDRNPLEIDPYDIGDIQVLETFIGGRRVYQAG